MYVTLNKGKCGADLAVIQCLMWESRTENKDTKNSFREHKASQTSDHKASLIINGTVTETSEIPQSI